MWRFRKSFTPLPGVRLTLSPSGITTSVGVGPLRLTAGPRGAHVTASVPGTGLSYRQALQSGAHSAPKNNPEPLRPIALEPAAPLLDDGFEMQTIESAGSDVLTTPGIAEFRRLLDQARSSHAETVRELTSAQKDHREATAHYERWRKGWLLRRIRKGRFAELAAVTKEARARRLELEEQEVLARLGTQIEVPTSIRATYGRLCDAFAQLAKSARIWDTVSHRAINQFVERSRATRAVERKPVSFRLGQCDVIKSEWTVPQLENANGGDIFMYPLFLVYFAGEQSFALLEYKDVQFTSTSTQFVEEEAVPSDSQVVGRTWAKTNKDGSPDRRFKENYEIPVTQYGKLVFRSSTGLNEEYMVSSLPSTEAFAKEWDALVQGIARGA